MPPPRTSTAATSAVVLALAAAGCGVDTSGTVIGDGGRATTTSTGDLPARSAGPPAEFVHAPSVIGMPVRAARLRIGAARFVPEPGQRYGVEGRTGAVVTFGPDDGDELPVVTQTPTHPQPSRYGTTVALGTVAPALPGRRRPVLEELSWRRVAYVGGAVELSGVRWGGDCRRLDHVQVGPPGGAVRSVRVWATNQSFPVEAGCEPAPTTIRVRTGNDWDPATSVWNDPLEQPRADVRPVRHVRYARVTVQPDRRTVMVTYLRGACEALARASVAARGGRATIDLRLGAVPPPAGEGRALCPAMRSAGTTVLRLPEALPRRAVFEDAAPGATAPGD
ncbi:hypothetical protein [Patulibacter minatonensis]|uniref:hypothetical protein n=1 Tax=Patulibacter minatonensis TaxID=298163 RepID=UPI00047B2BCB|nr:hypothetical protein [Patulibacter minatonensis]